MPRGVKSSVPAVKVGDRFGSRVAIREDGRDRYGHRHWLVRCDCGNEHVTPVRALRFAARCLKCRVHPPVFGRRVRPRRDDMGARGITLQPKELVRLVRADRLVLGPIDEQEREDRPQTRADCVGGARPCPWAGCRYHLAYDVMPSGTLKENFPGVELEDLSQTCALDVADEGGATLEEVGKLMNLTRERIRQVEFRGALILRRGLTEIYDAEEAEGEPQ